MILHCENLSKSFDGIYALAGVSVTFPENGIVAVIGPNGAGKTTLLNVLTGFLAPESGRLSLGERELTGLAPHKIARLGITRTFQDLHLIRQVSCLENVLLARPNQKGERLLPALFRNGIAAEEKLNHAEAMRWLKFVGLADMARQLAGELSYGQQKLLTLACCLATEAKILLLDEPVAGVHPEMIQKILSLVSELRGHGKLIVFIEHDIAAVKQIADQVIVMDEGKIIAQGKPVEILERSEIIEAYLT